MNYNKTKFMMRDACLNLKSQGLKTFLSVLSMIVGIAAFYVLLTLKCQTDFNKDKLLNEIGLHRFVAITTDQKVTIHNVDYLKNNKNKKIIPYELIYKPIYFNHKIMEGQIVLVPSEFFKLLNLNLKSGRFLNQSDANLNLKNSVIGSEIASKIQQAETIQIDQQGFQVVGHLKPAPLNPLFDFDINNTVFLDLSALRRFDFEGNLHNFLIEDPALDFTQSSVRFQKQVDIQYGVYPIFFKYPGLFIQAIEQQSKESLKLLTGVTVITLTLGIIGIFTMQWMSLLSRRSELGMRLSIGASPQILACLFFVENLLLIMGSGGIGLITGVISSFILLQLDHFFWLPILGTCLLSCFIGILSGIPVTFFIYRSQPANLLAYS